LPQPADWLCSTCAETLEPTTQTRLFSDSLAFDYYAFYQYRGVLKEVIKRFKYHDCPYLTNGLVGLMFPWLSQIDLLGYRQIVPVPLHVNRLRHRGYNQSALMALKIAKRFNRGQKTAASRLKVSLDNLVRIKDTPPQVDLDALSRSKNVKDAFRIKNRESVDGKSILLLDDVITTGSTVRECVKELHRAGAARITVIALATG